MLRSLDAARNVVWALPLQRAAEAAGALVREGVSLARALREQRVQCVGNQNKNSRIKKKFSHARKNFRCGDCIRETLPISCWLA